MVLISTCNIFTYITVKVVVIMSIFTIIKVSRLLV